MQTANMTNNIKKLSLITLVVAASSTAMASDGGFFSNVFGGNGYQPTGQGQEIYQEECSACHLAYPAPLQTKDKWLKIMSSLDDHFGDNAELTAETQKTITDYLIANAADTNGESSKLSKFARRSRDNGSLRITDLEGFKRKHDEIDKMRMVVNNPDVGSFSQCSACHGDNAQKGIFDEDTVKIPNFARWDD